MNKIHRYLCKSEWWRKTLEQKMMPWVLNGQNLGTDVLEIGPGPGLTTDLLRKQLRSITAIEIDSALALSLGNRMAGSNVAVVRGDATAMPFSDSSFSGAISLTMLHHVPTEALQDRLFGEAFRVLRPGGSFVAADSRKSLRMVLLHVCDTMVIVDPDTVGRRLESVGFGNVRVQLADRAFKVTARRP